MVKYFDFEKKIENIDNKLEKISEDKTLKNLDLINKFTQEKKEIQGFRNGGIIEN